MFDREYLILKKKIWSHDLGMMSLKRKSHKKSQHLLSWISIAMAFIPARDESLSSFVSDDSW